MATDGAPATAAGPARDGGRTGPEPLQGFLSGKAAPGQVAGILLGMTGAARGSRRAARAATEAAMLDAAARMLLQAPGTDVLGTLKPVEIARRCEPPRTTGAFYNIWPSQSAFRRALLDHVLSLDQFQADEAITDLLGQVAKDPDTDAQEAVRLVANLAFDVMRDDPSFRLQHALWTRADVDPDVRDGLRRLHQTITDTMTPRYREVLEQSGRRMAPPFTLDTLAVAIAALAEGLNVRRAIDPDAVPDDVGPPPTARPTAPDDGSPERRWSTFAALAHVLLDGMTEPIDPPVSEPPGATADDRS